MVFSFYFMAGKGHYVCLGESKHILRMDIPEGETTKSFAYKALCPECNSKLFWSEEFNQ